MSNLTGRLAVAFTILAVLAGTFQAASAQSSADCRRVLQEKSPALVTVKFIMKVKSGGKETETQAEVGGAMIDPKGLVLCSSTQLGGIGAVMRSMGRDISTTPTDLKVLVGDDTEGLAARLLTRDSDLDLAWVQIKDPGDRKFAFIDLSDSAEGQVGDEVIGLRRMTKYFDRAAIFTRTQIAGIVKKPRRLYMPIDTLPLQDQIGLPVFTPEGKVLGVAVLQGLSEQDQDQAADRATRALTLRELTCGLVLPAADVVEATKHAREAAASQPAETEPAASQPAAAEPKPKPESGE